MHAISPFFPRASLVLLLFVGFLNAEAEVYYVKPAASGGANSKDCRSHENACATLAGVNAKSPEIGSDVYFLAGGVWSGASAQQTMGWSGSASDPANIGAYIWNGSSAIIATSSSQFTKPLFDGENLFPTPVNETPMILIRGKTYVNVRFLRVVNASHMAIFAVNSTHVNFEYCESDNTYNAGMVFDNTDFGSIYRCIVKNAGVKGLTTTPWPMSLGVNKGCNDVVIKENVLENCVGEGIGAYNGYLNGGNYNIEISRNTIYGNRRVAIYMDCGRDIQVRDNLVYSTTDGRALDGNDGIGLTVEGWMADDAPACHTLDNVSVTGNLVANRGWQGIYISGHSAVTHSNITIANNTVIGAPSRSSVGGNFNMSGPDTFINVVVRNNISWCYSPTCRHSGVRSRTGMTWSNNLWFSSPGNSSSPDPDSGGNGDIFLDPKLIKSSGWDAVANGGLSGREFALLPGSPAINRGLDLGASFDNGLELDRTNWKTLSFVEADRDPVWEIGADVYLDTIIPAAPEDLRVR